MTELLQEHDFDELHSWRQVRAVLRRLNITNVEFAREAEISEGTLYRGVSADRQMQRSTKQVVVAALKKFWRRKQCS